MSGAKGVFVYQGSMKNTFVALFALSAFAGCQNSPTPSDATTDAQTQTAAQQAQTAAAQAQAAPTGELALVADGKNITFKSFLVWTEDVSGSMVPQMRFFVDEVGCDNRLSNEVHSFYAATQAENWGPGESLSPNWGFNGMPEFNPSSENDTGYPPAYWGKVTVVASTETEVQGKVDFSSKGVTVRGDFKATLCPGPAVP